MQSFKLSALMFFLLPAQAAALEAVYYPRFTGQFLTGHNQQLGGFGDVLLPFFKTAEGLLFVDSTVMLGDDQRYTYSGGVGYRVKTFGGIWGAYSFLDYYQSSLGSNYWQLNPGVEWITQRYEARLQGYVPLSNKQQIYHRQLASTLSQNVIAASGQTNTYFGARDHMIFDTPVGLYEAFGPGVELEAGRFFDYGYGFWLRAGAYHFAMDSPDGQVNGTEANAEIRINPKVSLLLQDNYDNQNKNVFSVGLRISIGGADTPNDTLAYRMTEPIIRHIARQSYGEPLPSRKNFKTVGPLYPVNENVWFFSPSGTAPLGAATTYANCTAENPCSTIDTATAQRINQIAPNANLFFSSGTYLIPGDPGWANLSSGQSIYGRLPGWFYPAPAYNQPLILGGLVWGNVSIEAANGTAYDISLNNTNQIVPSSALGSTNRGVIGLGATGNLSVFNSNIQALNTTNNINTIGIIGLSTRLSNTQVSATNQGNASGSGNSANAGGVIGFSSNTIENSTINVSTSGSGNNAGAQAIGIIALNNNAFTQITNSAINATAQGAAGTGGQSNAIGVFGKGSNFEYHIDNSSINVLTTGSATQGIVAGFGGTPDFFNSASYGSFIVNNSFINALSLGNANNSRLITMGLNTGANGALTINDSFITSRSLGNSTNGATIETLGISTLTTTLQNSTISVSGFGTVQSGSVLHTTGVDASQVIASGSQISVLNQAQGAGTIWATGINTTNSVTFIGNRSTVTVINSGNVTELINGSIRNNSTPKSQCSTDGVHYQDC